MQKKLILSAGVLAGAFGLLGAAGAAPSVAGNAPATALTSAPTVAPSVVKKAPVAILAANVCRDQANAAVTKVLANGATDAQAKSVGSNWGSTAAGECNSWTADFKVPANSAAPPHWENFLSVGGGADTATVKQSDCPNVKIDVTVYKKVGGGVWTTAGGGKLKGKWLGPCQPGSFCPSGQNTCATEMASDYKKVENEKPPADQPSTYRVVVHAKNNNVKLPVSAGINRRPEPPK